MSISVHVTFLMLIKPRGSVSVRRQTGRPPDYTIHAWPTVQPPAMYYYTEEPVSPIIGSVSWCDAVLIHLSGWCGVISQHDCMPGVRGGRWWWWGGPDVGVRCGADGCCSLCSIVRGLVNICMVLFAFWESDFICNTFLSLSLSLKVQATTFHQFFIAALHAPPIVAFT